MACVGGEQLEGMVEYGDSCKLQLPQGTAVINGMQEIIRLPAHM